MAVIVEAIPEEILKVFKEYTPEFVENNKLIIDYKRKIPGKEFPIKALYEIDDAIRRLENSKVNITRIPTRGKYSSYDVLFDILFIKLFETQENTIKLYPTKYKLLFANQSKIPISIQRHIRQFHNLQPIIPRNFIIEAIFSDKFPVYILGSETIVGIYLSDTPGYINIKDFIKWFTSKFKRIKKNTGVLKFRYGNMDIIAIYNKFYLRKMFISSKVYNRKTNKYETIKYTITIRTERGRHKHANKIDIIIEPGWVEQNSGIEILKYYNSKRGLPYKSFEKYINKKTRKLRMYLIFDETDNEMITLLINPNEKRNGIHYKVYKITTYDMPYILKVEKMSISKVKDDKINNYIIIDNTIYINTDEIIDTEGYTYEKINKYTGYILRIQSKNKHYIILLPPKNVIKT